MPEHGFQRRGIVSTVVLYPSPQERIEYTAISSNERTVSCRMFKSRTVDRMAFSEDGLTAGVKLQNSSLFREL